MSEEAAPEVPLDPGELEDHTELFRLFDFDVEQQQLFLELKPLAANISNNMLAALVCQKKTREKCFPGLEAITAIFEQRSPFDNSEKLAAWLYCISWLVENYPDASVNGLVVVMNTQGMGITDMNFSLIKGIHQFIGKLPLRPQKACLMYPPFLFKALFTLIRPFLATKVVDRLCVTADLNALDEVVDLSMLPRAIFDDERCRVEGETEEWLGILKTGLFRNDEETFEAMKTEFYQGVEQGEEEGETGEE